nr:hypothetical protein [Tanacetum cinerariifolium]
GRPGWVRGRWGRLGEEKGRLGRGDGWIVGGVSGSGTAAVEGDNRKEVVHGRGQHGGVGRRCGEGRGDDDALSKGMHRGANI